MSTTALNKTRRRVLSALAVVALALGWHVAKDPAAFWADAQAGFHDAFDPGLQAP